MGAKGADENKCEKKLAKKIRESNGIRMAWLLCEGAKVLKNLNLTQND